MRLDFATPVLVLADNGQAYAASATGAPSADVSKLAAAREAIAALGVTVHQPNEAIGVEAARLRQRHPISLPDAYCLATAKHTGSTLSSFDQKILKAAKREGVKAA